VTKKFNKQNDIIMYIIIHKYSQYNNSMYETLYYNNNILIRSL